MATYALSASKGSSGRSPLHNSTANNNGSNGSNGYSSMVRQLESSPSSTRRAFHSLRKQHLISSSSSNGNGGPSSAGKHYSLHLNSISTSPSLANSTFDSALPERYGGSSSRSTDYSGGGSYQQQQPPPQVHYHHHHHSSHQQQQPQSPSHQASLPKRPSPTEVAAQQKSYTINNRHPSSPDYYDRLTSRQQQQQQYNSGLQSRSHQGINSPSKATVSTFDRSNQGTEQESAYQRIGEPSTINSRTLNSSNHNQNDNYFSLSEMNDEDVVDEVEAVVGGPGPGGSIGPSEDDSLEDGVSVISRKLETGGGSTAERTCDKYGFFLENSEDEEGGGLTGGGGPGTTTETKVPTSAEVKAIRVREKKWLQMLHNWRYYIDFKWEKIRDRCRKGIPHSLRSQAWFYLVGGHLQKRRRPLLYADLLTRTVPEEVRSDITKDLHRQFPGHELFAERSGAGQTELFNVLKAFAAYRPAQGYCQAQGPIAAVLLMHMPAEHAFWSLVALNDYYIGGYFTHNLEEIEIHGRMLAAFLRRYSPTAYSLLKRQNVEPVLYMTEWFMCIYSRSLPWASVLRVWDMFLCEGVTVLFKVGIYIVDVTLRGENSKTCPSMYETCQKLRATPRAYLEEKPLLKGLGHIDLKDADLLREHKIQLKKHRKAKAKLERSRADAK